MILKVAFSSFHCKQVCYSSEESRGKLVQVGIVWGAGGHGKSHDKGLKLSKGALQNLLLDLSEGMGEASIVAGEDFALETNRQWQAYTNFPIHMKLETEVSILWLRDEFVAICAPLIQYKYYRLMFFF